jgi:hypothetical protein
MLDAQFFFGLSVYLTENQNVTHSLARSYLRGLAFLFKILPYSLFINFAALPPPPPILYYKSRVLEIETKLDKSPHNYFLNESGGFHVCAGLDSSLPSNDIASTVPKVATAVSPNTFGTRLQDYTVSNPRRPDSKKLCHNLYPLPSAT